LEWIGGEPIVYEPGSTITVEDSEVRAICHCLEGTDAEGRSVLERARAAVNAPARRTLMTDVPQKDMAWLIRATDESLRRQGQVRELVIRMLERGDQPSVSDLVSALKHKEPPTREIIDYVVQVLTQPQRPGPKGPSRTTWQDLAIQAFYDYELDQARRAHEANSRKPRAVANVAKLATAKAFNISKRTVERALSVRTSATL
jgi:hypothetical protein